MDTIDTTTLLAVVVGVVLPALVALVTKHFTSSGFKSLTLLFLAVVSSVLTPLVGSGTFDLNAVLTAFATTFGTAVLTYYGLLKPTGATEAIATRVPGGIGTEVALPGYEIVDATQIDKTDELPAPEPVDLPAEGAEVDSENG
jgi:hypothetical protein